MTHWKVTQPSRLLTEVKSKFAGVYTTQQVRWAIEHNRCFVNGQMERFCSTRLNKGDTVTIHWQKEKPNEQILFEDESVIVCVKPPFLTSEALAKKLKGLLVHRLDRDTTGLFLLAKSDIAKSHLEKQFKERKIEKKYLALVEGEMRGQGVIKGYMSPQSRRQGGVVWGMAPVGVWSLTAWDFIERRGNYSLVQCLPHTGRTHQIRVHLSFIGHPILGDPIYGSRQKKGKLFRPLLHASEITFIHPLTEELLSFSSPPPSDFFSF